MEEKETTFSPSVLQYIMGKSGTVMKSAPVRFLANLVDAE